MEKQLTFNKSRFESIDILRGIVMLIMALDHVRDFFHAPANLDDPLNLATTYPVLYFTRWVTHFCAPVFVFLSGVSIYLQSLRKTKKQLSLFLIKRGLWLIFMEWAIISLAWTFDPLYHIFIMQVIWAIGISMVILGLLIHLPYRIILVIGLLIVFGHNLLDIPESAPGFKAGFWWDLFHHGFFALYQWSPGRYFMMIYPFMAWTGLMMVGYCAGILFTERFSAAQRKKILIRTGLGLIFLFILVRFINIYGDPAPWSKQNDSLYTFLSFMKLTKYPPSLLYLSITIGPALLTLAFIEDIKNRFTNIMAVYGRTAFFYYILHFYFIHTAGAIVFFIKGEHTVQEAINSMKNLPFLFIFPGEGFGLGIVYLIWICLIVVLYPLCKWYDKYKATHKEKWWLSYF
ncbi:MAG: heparan-alpha-glucosaminide N-acetyltransferase domain-containing protein [Ferruginibacter sp.]